MGVAAGFFVNLTGMALPGPVQDGLDLMVRAALPAALFGLGGVLVQYRPEGDLRVILYVCLISLVVHPAITLGLGVGLGLPDEGVRSAVVTAAMAPGVNAYVFANIYGHAKRVAASSVLISTALTVMTAWLWLQVLP
jgi:predicted permease